MDCADKLLPPSSSGVPRHFLCTECGPHVHADDRWQCMVCASDCLITPCECDEIAAWKLVIVESPFVGDVNHNLAYLRAAMHDCFMRHEAPFASHGLYTQPGVLDDSNPHERAMGIQAGFAWRKVARRTAVYTDLGVTEGMQEGIVHAQRAKHLVEYRQLEGW